MLNLVRKISKTHSVFKCVECENEYITNHYDAKKSPVGHLCSQCKSYEGYEVNQAFMQKFFTYKPSTGELIARLPVHNRPVGTVVGSKGSHGYLMTGIQGKNLLNHRLIWLYMTGEFPTQIDHIDHDKLNNAIDNLRLVSVADNNRNRVRRTGKVDEAGIWYCRRRQRYIAEITYNQKKVYQRSFIDIDEAISHRKAKLLELGFHPKHGDKA